MAGSGHLRRNPCRSVGPNDPELEEQIIQYMVTTLENAPPN